jgi:hypothetical protein
LGWRVLVVDRGATEPHVRVIELPKPLELLGIHDDQLILLGSDDSRCSDDEFFRPIVCRNVFRRATEGEPKTEFVAAFDVFAPVLVGDHVVAIQHNKLISLPLMKGEVRRLRLEHVHSTAIQVQGDRLLWHAIVHKGATRHSAVYQSISPFDKVERVFLHEATREAEQIVDVAWIGDDIAFLVRSENQEVKLYRRIGFQTHLLLIGLGAEARLEHDSNAAWLFDWKPGAERLWRIEPEEHRPITFSTAPMHVTGTRWGLVWMEKHGSVDSFHLAGTGPANREPPELPVRAPDMRGKWGGELHE